MYRLSSLILVLFGFTQIFSQSSPHGDQFKIECIKCHTSESWKVDSKTIQFDHSITSFQLEGAHTDADCIGCHKTLVFNEAQNDCMSCHTDMHSASVGNDCARCHSPKSWTVDNIPELHEANGFPLTGPHTGVDCQKCHISETNLTFDRIGNDCINCHKSTFENTRNPDHVAGNFSTSCTDCHSSFTQKWTPTNIQHDFFPLTLGHEVYDCKKCHINNNFENISTDCVSCHQTTFDNTTNPNHVTAGFNTDCISCHTTDPGWTPATFDHSIFPLTLGHDITDCNACHTTTVYADQPTDCVSCHQTTFNSTTNPNHVTAGFPTDCVTCHTTNPGWTPSTFNHDFFPLTQGHDLPDCKQCHTTANFSDQVADCVSCHQTTFDSTISPNHTSAGFTTDCITCHTTNVGWSPTTFDHSVFPLTLGHDLGNSLTDCKQCHISDNFSDASPDCVSCHQTTFNNTTNPDHVTAGFPTDCITCHTTNPGWTPVTWNHDFFPLTQGHDLPDCKQCHTTANFSDQVADCVSCHQTTFDNTTNPNHAAAGFPTDCVACHTTNPGWTPTTFDHNSFAFPLTLGHNITDCKACHTTVVYADQPTDCVSCHQTTFDSTTNPNHVTAGFPTDCVACHTTNPGWTPTTFDHNSFAFPLTLGHNITDCKACHTTAVYADQPTDCVSCHQTTFDNTTNPNHVAAGFPTDCVACHTTNPGWTPATFDHTNFPLTLGHDITDCTQCHINGNYTNTSSTCVSCHQTTYDNTTNPNHVAAGFPTDCVACHTTNPGWTPATFDHTNFPLTLGHDITDCTQCHINGNYTNTSSTCVSCHQTTYDNTTNPNHLSTGFSTDCVACHTTNPGWTPSTFDHAQYFPITSGKHSGFNCIECHTTANTLSTFSCIACHEHNNQSSLASEHSGVSGYTYVSTECYSCHPTGNKDGGSGGD